MTSVNMDVAFFHESGDPKQHLYFLPGTPEWVKWGYRDSPSDRLLMPSPAVERLRQKIKQEYQQAGVNSRWSENDRKDESTS